MNPRGTAKTRAAGRRAALAVIVTGLGLTTLVPGTPAAAAAGRPGPAVTWKPCPAYSDEALRAMAPPELLDRFKSLLARLECGTVSAPLDYSRPHGRQITVALTRLKAQDQAHRLGSLALNPGGRAAAATSCPSSCSRWAKPPSSTSGTT